MLLYLKCGLGLVTDTTWTAKRLFNWTEVKQSPDGFNRQYSLEGHIFQFVLLSICVRLSRSHTFFSCPLHFYISNPLHSPTHLSTHFSFSTSVQESIMSSLSSSFLTSLTPLFITTVFPVIIFLSPTLLLRRPEPWHSINTIFQLPFILKGYLKAWNCA